MTFPKYAVTACHFLEIAASFVALLKGFASLGEACREFPIFAPAGITRGASLRGKTFDGVS
jgi:hypothetical protein